MMLPHWQKFAKALHGRTSVEKMEITGIKMPLSVLDIMFPTLQTMNLTTLKCYDIGLGFNEYTCLLSFLRENTSLRRVALGRETIDDLSIATSLSDVLGNHPTLDVVIFDNCGLNDIEVLEIILVGCKRIHKVIMKDNLRSEAVRVISEFILSNHPVGFLRLDGNEITSITEASTTLLATALKQNTHLFNLKLFSRGWKEGLPNAIGIVCYYI